MATDSLLTERSEKTKCRGVEKKADCLGMKGEGSMLDLTEGDCSCERKKFSLSFSQGNNSNLSEILPFQFFSLGKLLVQTNSADQIN